MKRSVSSVLAALREKRKLATPKPISVRKVKFSPAEMAYDVPSDTSHLAFKRVNPGVVVLDPDVAKVFKTAESVNLALRKIIEAMPAGTTGRKPKGRKRVA